MLGYTSHNTAQLPLDLSRKLYKRSLPSVPLPCPLHTASPKPPQTLTNRNPTSSEDTPLSLVSSSSLPSLKDVLPHGSVSLYLISVEMVLMTVSRFNSDDNYPNNSYRDRIRFLLFVSWWTVVFTAGYLAFFIINAGSFLVSIASHGIFLALT